MTDLLGTIQGIGTSVLSFVQESNRHTESLRNIRAGESVALAQQGFTTGRATPAVFPQGFPSVSVGGGAGFSLAGMGPLLMLGLAGLLVLKVLK